MTDTKSKKVWVLSIFNSKTGKLQTTEKFKSIAQIAKTYKQLNEDTWRNMSIGRSKVYDPFFKLEHKTL